MTRPIDGARSARISQSRSRELFVLIGSDQIDAAR